MSDLLQFLFSGLTVGAAYALTGLGFTLIFNASGVINFAQGEFVMLGGMLSVAFHQAGLPLALAVPLAILATGAAGLAVERLAIAPARRADAATLIITTIGASLVLRGLVQVELGKGIHALPAFSSDTPLKLAGASILPQSLWVLGVMAVAVAVLGLFFARSRLGKAMLAASHNRLAAELVGIDVRAVLLSAFGLAAALGALGGALLTPVIFTSYDTGVMLGLKGFVAAALGGLGSVGGAIAGGLLVGVIESMTAGYLSSTYKDAVPFVMILLILFFRPQGLFGTAPVQRV